MTNEKDYKFAKKESTLPGNTYYRMFCSGTCQQDVSTQADEVPVVCPICNSSSITTPISHIPFAQAKSENGEDWDLFVDNDGLTKKARRG